jgi:ABC-type nitrate/sulfonate/bicarbonate transport system substrate-binding protein
MARRCLSPIVVTVALTLLVGAPGSLAQNLEPVSVIVFPGGFNWPIWAAEEKGYFAKGGIEVRLTPTPGSVFQLTGLIEGKFDIAETAIDNVIAYMEGQGEASVSVKPDLFVFMGGDSGLLSLTVLPEIKTYADLKGKTLSVDAMTTGYAFVLFDLLKRNGLSSGDYNLVRAGGVLERWEGLRNRRHAARAHALRYPGQGERTQRSSIRARRLWPLSRNIRRGAAVLGRGKSQEARSLYPRLSRGSRVAVRSC